MAIYIAWSFGVRSLNRKKVNFTKNRKRNSKRPYLSRNNKGIKHVWNSYYDVFTSWSWVYPYFHSPMISDSNSSPSISNLINCVRLNFSFNLSNPFKLFDKTMGVLPELISAHISPKFYLSQIC
ncbi:uncharacterized protein VP01_3185g1 [Puccinia sorghi]|uniref:Xrn1 helical domain-containing protein n=1 Tax=Puccinia sorghi TaxID=27349 RepID=A0A0L6UYI7_9BASI|nr:uncharacterized protein VP01_3185g1 [Puccinia sorghi]